MRNACKRVRSPYAIAISAAIVCCFLAVLFGPGFAANETHLDKAKLPQGCSSCHKGHGKRATVMLELAKDDLCFKCHGPEKKGRKGEAKDNIYSVILKRSNHPITQTSQLHVPGETLPERNPSTPRHVACPDCHNPHLLTKDKTFKGSKGYSGRGYKSREVQSEYEICYLCHSDSANLPPQASNIAQKFDPGNASFHPVETTGRGSSVPSLRGNMPASSVIRCSDCHGNDDRSGPKGPHGSNYTPLLKYNYTMSSGSESPFAYELCYSCHNRSSILNDESFNAHKAHVIYGAESCFACHDAHGSRDNEHLINFDRKVASNNSLGQFNYMRLSPGRPRCFISCHGYDHKIVDKDKAGKPVPPKYCVNDNCPPGW